MICTECQDDAFWQMADRRIEWLARGTRHQETTEACNHCSIAVRAKEAQRRAKRQETSIGRRDGPFSWRALIGPSSLSSFFFLSLPLFFSNLSLPLSLSLFLLSPAHGLLSSFLQSSMRLVARVKPNDTHGLTHIVGDIVKRTPILGRIQSKRERGKIKRKKKTPKKKKKRK
ncbi:hypothetical protein P170DRAFT_207659 [Aspergillus steynii IBT 23096]|uniref:Uncharacterized protein n=1 Tax=Aspergillus steynii IBT 23096 TaxID=1392250 RepID=A0A2I2G5J5_9EURO|nr:uncharacterized protein P170DRAFT_207659 [Aspergillus steynii IBT 23096]PLB48151.1 hypothetical protein P170DRAFT_207659 [Aspergillus steynii IBT 23096]